MGTALCADTQVLKIKRQRAEAALEKQVESLEKDVETAEKGVEDLKDKMGDEAGAMADASKEKDSAHAQPHIQLCHAPSDRCPTSTISALPSAEVLALGVHHRVQGGARGGTRCPIKLNRPQGAEGSGANVCDHACR